MKPIMARFLVPTIAAALLAVVKPDAAYFSAAVTEAVRLG